jgi:hypothetical protein
MLQETSQAATEQSESLERPAVSRPSRWVAVLSLAFAVGFLWPIPVSEMTSRLSDHGTLAVTLTLLVAAGAIAGFVLPSRLTLPLVPVAIYLGGFASWLVSEGSSPQWDIFVAASAAALGTLTLTTGVAAFISSRVVGIESRPLRRGSTGIRIAAALSAFLALVAAAVSFGVPFGVFGAIFGIGAILAGIAVLEEGDANGIERSLAISGIAFASLVVVWDLIAFALLVYRFIG